MAYIYDANGNQISGWNGGNPVAAFAVVAYLVMHGIPTFAPVPAL